MYDPAINKCCPPAARSGWPSRVRPVWGSRRRVRPLGAWSFIRVIGQTYEPRGPGIPGSGSGRIGLGQPAFVGLPGLDVRHEALRAPDDRGRLAVGHRALVLQFQTHKGTSITNP